MYDNIQLIPTDDLLKELFSRYDCVVFAGVKQGINVKEDNLVHRKWDGPSLIASGLASNLKLSIDIAMIEDGEDGEEVEV